MLTYLYDFIHIEYNILFIDDFNIIYIMLLIGMNHIYTYIDMVENSSIITIVSIILSICVVYVDF